MNTLILQYIGIIIIAICGPFVCGIIVNNIFKLYNRIVLRNKAKQFKVKLKEMESEIAKERELNNIEVEITGEVIK